MKVSKGTGREEEMEKRLRNRRILDIVLIILVIAAAGILFAKLFYNSSQKKVLSNLAEISNQSAKVFQREAEKGKDIISNLAILLGQHDTCEVNELIEEIKPVDESNDFKRMGIIMPDGAAYTTDGVVMDLDGRDYFKRSMDGSVMMSDTLKDVEGGDKINVYSAPVNFRDGFRCVLFATLETSNFKSALAETIYSGEGYSYIIKGNGDYIVGEGASHEEKQFDNIYSFMQERSGKNESAVKELKRGVSKGDNGYVVFRDEMEYYMYYQPLSVNQWFLLTVVPGKVIKQSMGEILTLAYLFIFFCSCLIIILILQINRIRQVSRKDLEKIAFTDEATGMTNFNKFKVEAKQILEDNHDLKYVVVCFNIHKFQYINDLFGYAEGDRALTYVAGVIQEHLRDKEAFARMLADHFVALLQEKDKRELKGRVEDIIAHLQSRTDFGGKHYEIKATAGIYQIEPGVDEIDTMVDRAKMALNRPEGELLQVCCYYDDTMRDRKIRTKDIEDHFETALEKREFIIYYQPKFDIEKQCYDGAEALVRWQSPEKGLVTPGEFVPVFENNGTIVQLDQYIFEEVCRQIKKWLEDGYEVAPVSVNVSRLHLYRQDFVDTYLNIINKYKVPVHLIELELTETVLLDNEEILVGILEKFHQSGIHILMDDFGSGYSSLNTLKNIPIDLLKMDKTLIDDYENNSRSKKIITSVIALARELGIKVVAEGVETKEQYKFLESISCDYIQGYYCSRPIPQADYEDLLRRNSLETGCK